jgi:tetratricopeptide (TPR) repeat protein
VIPAVHLRRTRRIAGAALLSSLLALIAAPGFSRDPGEIAELIRKVREASPSERPLAVQALASAGREALEPAKKARDAEADPELKRAFGRAVTWIVAREAVGRLEEGLKTQLNFDGQYDSLEEFGAEAPEALLALIDDEATHPEIRLAACRALADVGDRSLLPRLRALHHDILLYPMLREQMGILLAIFGDTRVLEPQFEKLLRITRQPDPPRQSDPRLRLAALERRHDAYLDLANLYYRTRDYDKAVEFYEAILAINKELADSLGRLRLPLIESYVEEVARRQVLYYYNAACSNSLKGDFERAKKYLKEAVQGDPSHYANIEKDGDLSKLRAEPGFPEFLRELGKLFEDEAL